MAQEMGSCHPLGGPGFSDSLFYITTIYSYILLIHNLTSHVFENLYKWRHIFAVFSAFLFFNLSILLHCVYGCVFS